MFAEKVNDGEGTRGQNTLLCRDRRASNLPGGPGRSERGPLGRQRSWRQGRANTTSTKIGAGMAIRPHQGFEKSSISQNGEKMWFPWRGLDMTDGIDRGKQRTQISKVLSVVGW